MMMICSLNKNTPSRFTSFVSSVGSIKSVLFREKNLPWMQYEDPGLEYNADPNTTLSIVVDTGRKKNV